MATNKKDTPLRILKNEKLLVPYVLAYDHRNHQHPTLLLSKERIICLVLNHHVHGLIFRIT